LKLNKNTNNTGYNRSLSKRCCWAKSHDCSLETKYGTRLTHKSLILVIEYLWCAAVTPFGAARSCQKSCKANFYCKQKALIIRFLVRLDEGIEPRQSRRSHHRPRAG